MVFEGLKDRLGLGERIAVYSEKDKMIKLILMILIPFYVVWGLFNILFFMKYQTESIMVLICGFFAWGAGIVIVLNQRQIQAGTYHCFREATWRMTVTKRIKTDIYVDRDIEYIGRVGGYQVYKPHFPIALSFKHPHFNGGKGITFNTAFWLLPDKWEQTFFPVPECESWYGSLPVSVKAEDLTLHNLRWAEKKGEFIPVALVVDSNRHFEATMGRVSLGEESNKVEVAQFVSEIASLTTENIDLALELAQEVQTNRGLLKATDNIVELTRAMVQDIKKRHGDIKRIPIPMRLRINWRLLSAVIITLGIIGFLAVIILQF